MQKNNKPCHLSVSQTVKEFYLYILVQLYKKIYQKYLECVGTEVFKINCMYL